MRFANLPLRLAILIPLAVMAAGCAAKLKQIESPDRGTYVYGFAEITGASKFQINLKNVATGKRHAYSKGWLAVPFMKKEILFAFQIEPGEWVLESITAAKGGQVVIPTGPTLTFTVAEGKGNYMGRITNDSNPFTSFTSIGNDQGSESKGEVDEKMGAEFSTFEPANTVLIAFQKK